MNETYRMIRQAIDDAATGKRSRCLMFVRPSNCGKSDTAYIVSRDMKANMIPCMSASEQKGFFTDRIHDFAFILDDPSDWYIEKDLLHLMSVLKNMLTGWLKAARATKFDFNIPLALEHKVCIVIFANPEQYNCIRGSMTKTGLDARAEIYFVKHTPEERLRISKIYEENKYCSTNLPRFKETTETDFPLAFLNSFEKKRFFEEQIEFEEVKT